MTEEESFEVRNPGPPTPIFIGVVMLIMALFLPLALTSDFDFGFQGPTIVSATWLWRLGWTIYSFVWEYEPLSYIFSILPFTFLRYFFVYIMVDYYRGNTTLNQVYYSGIACELQFSIMYIFFDIFQKNSVLPIPLLIVVGILLLRIFPPKWNLMWIEIEEPNEWWPKLESENSEPPVSTAEEKIDQKETDSP